MSFRNRCVIAGADGPIILSVPLEGGRNQRKPMKEVRIDNRKDWQVQHWRTIVSCYNRSPWFEFYRDELDMLYQGNFSFLAGWDEACFQWVSGKIGLPVKSQVGNEPRQGDDDTGKCDWRNRFIPATISHDFPEAVKYRQVFEERTGFMPHLSVLDLLFCEGKNALRILSR